MAQHIFTLDTMPMVGNGKADAAFQKHVKRAVLDCMDRPADLSAREVTLTFKIVPVPESSANGTVCERVTGSFEIKSKVPTHKTADLSFKVRATGGLVFSEDAPDNVDQMTMND